MANSQYPDLRVNSQRALLFLQLAIAQLRLYDDDAANEAHKCHLRPLTHLFDDALQRVKHYELDQLYQSQAQSLVHASQDYFDEFTLDMPPAPPGLGFGHLLEAKARKWTDWKSIPVVPISHQDENDPPAAAAVSPWTSTVPWEGHITNASDTVARYGVIGQRKTSTTSSSSGATTAVPSSLLSTLVYDFDSCKSATPPEVFKKPAVPTPLVERHPGDKIRRPSGLSNMTLMSPAVDARFEIAFNDEESGSDRSHKYESIIQEDPASEKAEKQDLLAAPSSHIRNISSWAKVAAIPQTAAIAATTTNTSSANVHFSGHITTNALTKHQFRLNSAPRDVHVQLSNTETAADKLRAVWITNLPSTYTVRDISSRIEIGPIMSILLENDVSHDVSGRSACIIFQYAEHVLEFLAANASSTQPTAATNADPTYKPASLYTSTAPNATLIPPAPFPLDPALLSMRAPTFARRRLKWSRSRLFYDVPLLRFKRDVFELCGAQNVEFCHFYNPGEATVVFASVAVAEAVLKAFRRWARQDDAEVREGGQGGQAARYKGVDVAYVKDFNEAPAKLYTQYGPDGRVRKFANCEGVEGLFSGPSLVGVEDVNCG